MSVLNRAEIRRLEKAAREKDKKHLMEWAASLEREIEQNVRKEYEKRYEEAFTASIDTFLIANAYTAIFSETTQLTKDTLPEFMEDLLVTVDMFRTGEYTPEEYKQILDDYGVFFEPSQYNHYIKKKEDKEEKENDDNGNKD